MDDSRKQEFLEQHWPLFGPLYSSIEEGIQKGHRYFEQEERPACPWLFAHIVRFHVCRRLEELQDSDIQFRAMSLPMSGVEIEFMGLTIKVLKADRGEIPAAGRSRRRQDFYNGNNLFGSDFDVFRLENWAVVWDLDGVIQLICPSDAEAPHRPGCQRMAIALPHPAEVKWAPPPSLSAHSDLDLEELTENDVEDFDIAVEKNED